MNDKPVKDMTEDEVRLMLLRLANETFGVVPSDAVRHRDGSYTVYLKVNLEEVNQTLACVECGRVAAHNIHRPDLECEDPALHMRTMPRQLHHPFATGRA